MIRFQHQGVAHSLEAGAYWRALAASEETYRDTPRTELSSLVEAVSAGQPWREAVAARYQKDNPWLWRIVTDPSRDLFFRQYPPRQDSLILDVGSGWGQLTLPLAAENRVVSLEPTPERLAFVRAAAKQEGLLGKLCFIEAGLQQVEFPACFDLVCCVGVLEWVPRFVPGEPRAVQVDFLRRLGSCLAPGGRLVVGIENRIGLKYLLGTPDDHTGQSGVSVLEHPLAARRHLELTGTELRVFTYSMSEYEGLFLEAGLRLARGYGAWPDYKLPERIIPLGGDFDRLLLEGASVREHNGYNGAPLDASVQEALTSHYRTLARQGGAGGFAPSFFLEGEAL